MLRPWSRTSGRGEHHQPRHRHDRPIGKGQRGLLVAPPKSGKTVMLQHIAHAITANHPGRGAHRAAHRRAPGGSHRDTRTVKGEVVASTFDEPATRHVAGRRDGHREGQAPGRAQEGRGDPARLDRPRLARAYNTVVPRLGQGADRRRRRQRAAAKPKRFFGAARNIEEGGSLTIIATALIDTGSRMDDVIYEEFKGTGGSVCT